MRCSPGTDEGLISQIAAHISPQMGSRGHPQLQKEAETRGCAPAESRLGGITVGINI